MNVRLEKLEKKVGQMYSFESILGESKPLKEAVQLARKVSVTDVPVLLTGETAVSYTHLRYKSIPYQLCLFRNYNTVQGVSPDRKPMGKRLIRLPVKRRIPSFHLWIQRHYS